MLRRLKLTSPWRSFDNSTWPETADCGQSTFIYGHNGSGKSTLAELLLSLSEENTDIVQDTPESILWVDEKGDIQQYGNSGTPFSHIKVFTRKWTAKNLKAFLEGDDGDAIVTLGVEAIQALEQEEELQSRISELQGRQHEAQETLKRSEDIRSSLLQQAQYLAIDKLQQFDPDFSELTFTTSDIEAHLTASFRPPSQEDYDNAISQLSGSRSRPIAVPNMPVNVFETLTTPITQVLERQPGEAPIRELAENTDWQLWVRQGLTLHEDRSTCIFCENPLNEDRLSLLKDQFNEDWERISTDGLSIHSKLYGYLDQLNDFLENLPCPDDLVASLQFEYTNELEIVTEQLEVRIQLLTAISDILMRKVTDPSQQIALPDFTAVLENPPTEKILSLLNWHNQLVSDYRKLDRTCQETVKLFIIAEIADPFKQATQEFLESKKVLKEVSAALHQENNRLRSVRERRFTTNAMAETLSTDLARVYGRHHLQIRVSENGKSYRCYREGARATDLSEGEQTTLALLYFLRSLESEGMDPSQTLVVVDDPSSSLDREALYATYQWLLDRLAQVQQYIVLTHDFGLLSLFLNAKAKDWRYPQGSAHAESPEDIELTKASFLQCYTVYVDDQRKTRINRLPNFLGKNASEYEFLFHSVMLAAVGDPNSEQLAILPNVMRRVLENFCSFKAPHESDFRSRLAHLVKEIEDEPYEDVYRFINNLSHGTGDSLVNGIDTIQIYGNLRRSLKFMHAVDEGHFHKLCQRVGLKRESKRLIREMTPGPRGHQPF